jgi:hypothetical protein
VNKTRRRHEDRRILKHKYGKYFIEIEHMVKILTDKEDMFIKG